MRLSKIDKYLNTAFDGNYFETDITWELFSKGNLDYPEAKSAYYAKTVFIPSNSSVLRVKRHSNRPYNQDDRDEFLEDFTQLLVNCVIFSKPTNKNNKFYKENGCNFIKSFADYKKEILELKKNKVNE